MGLANAKCIRVIILSDTHGFVDPRILEAARGSDVVVHAGDIGNAAVLAALRCCGGELVAVRGNNDSAERWPRADGTTLDALPTQGALDLPGGRLLVVHGDRVLPASGRHARLRERFPDVRVVVYGHTHKLRCDRTRLPWVLNPGAAGRSRTFGGPSGLVLRARGAHWDLQVIRFKPLSIAAQTRGGDA
jgi:uncharacterized protein